MLRLFSSIRKTLINEGKTSRYVRYAVGEVLLIMVGILLALEANEWKEERRDARRETEYLNRLVTNLNSDIERWSSHYEFLEEKQAALRGVLDWIDNPNFEELRLSKLAIELTLGSLFSYGGGAQAYRTVFDELVSTGHLNVLSDSELRERLQHYYDRVEINELRIAGRETKYAQRAYELVPRDPEFTVTHGLEYNDLEQIGERTLHADLKSLIIGEQNRARLRREIADEHMELANELIALVTTELD